MLDPLHIYTWKLGFKTLFVHPQNPMTTHYDSLKLMLTCCSDMLFLLHVHACCFCMLNCCPSFFAHFISWFYSLSLFFFLYSFFSFKYAFIVCFDPEYAFTAALYSFFSSFFCCLHISSILGIFLKTLSKNACPTGPNTYLWLILSHSILLCHALPHLHQLLEGSMTI
jgi:hypothetical protein